MNEQASAWLSAIDGLPQVHDRLKRVAILNRDAIDVVRGHDDAGTLFYIDPPYLAETRSAPSVYAHEMTAGQHLELLATLKSCAGMVILSGYPSELYTRELAGWPRIEIDRANSAAGGASKRRMTEVLWTNFEPEAA
jgi:DNA adenine methylase